jgi:hypothetical protein
LVNCDATDGCLRLLLEERAVFQEGIGIAMIGNLDVRDSVCK